MKFTLIKVIFAGYHIIVKTLFIKQKYDITGPVYDSNFLTEKPFDILNRFKWKSGHPFQFGLKFKFEFKVVDNYKLFSWQLSDKLINKQRQNYIDDFYSNKNLPHVLELDLSKYDLIFTSNPFLPIDLINKYRDILFISEPAEHWDESIYLHDNNYDLMWNHTPSLAKHQIPVKKLYSAKKMFYRPYMTDYKSMQSLFDFSKIEKNIVFIGWRTSNYISSDLKSYIQDRLEKLDLHPYFTGSNPFDENSDNDSAHYWQMMSKSKYYIDLSCRLGQQLQDSSTVNVVNIGNAWKKELIYKKNYVPEILNDEFLMTKELINKILKIILNLEKNSKMYHKALDYQKSVIVSDENKTMNKLYKNKKINKKF